MIQQFDWQNLEPEAGFDAWRAAKCRFAEDPSLDEPVEIGRLATPTAAEAAETKRRCAGANFALYQALDADRSVERTSEALIGFAGAFGLRVAEAHRSAGHSGVVALRQTEEEGKKGYIPYTPRPLNWHTDGYYNAPDHPVHAFVLHCLAPAARGGANQLIDPEVAYLRLREANPAYVRALMHPQAMTIPENREPDGTLRPASVGPVFFADPVSGRLQMRYTARTRSIEWRDDPLTREAVAWMGEWLAAGDPMRRDLRLDAGQGILNNNVLHNRSGFEDGPTAEETRVILRVRFHNRIAED